MVLRACKDFVPIPPFPGNFGAALPVQVKSKLWMIFRIKCLPVYSEGPQIILDSF